MSADDLRPKGTVQVPCSHPDCVSGGWEFWVDALDPRLPDGPFLCVEHDPKFRKRRPCAMCKTIVVRHLVEKQGAPPTPVLCDSCFSIFLPRLPRNQPWSQEQQAEYDHFIKMRISGDVFRPMTDGEYRFTCPRCGGHEWGTGDGEVGFCHGYALTETGVLVPCKYNWPRAKDAELHPNLVEGPGREEIGEFSIVATIKTKM